MMQSPLLGTAYTISEESKVGRIIGFFLTLAATILIIVAVAVPNLYHTTIDGADAILDVGPFRATTSITVLGDNYPLSCPIDNSCNCQFTLMGTDLPQYQVADKCGVWNTGRGMATLAIILGALGLVFQLIAFCTPNSSIRSMAFSFPSSACLVGLISMAIFAYEKDNDKSIKQVDGETVKYGYGFALLIVSWIVFGIGAGAFGLRRRV